MLVLVRNYTQEELYEVGVYLFCFFFVGGFWRLSNSKFDPEKLSARGCRALESVEEDKAWFKNLKALQGVFVSLLFWL
jgi:hypothetical protein